MLFPDEVWDRVRRLLLARCPRCDRLRDPRDRCSSDHCAACCGTRALCSQRLLARHNSGRLWRWSLGQHVFCLRCGADLDAGELHWVLAGEGGGYGAVCPRCGAGEDSLVPAVPGAAMLPLGTPWWEGGIAPRRPAMMPPWMV